MKLLVDTCVSELVCAALRAAGHDVLWTGNWPVDPGDEAILAKAVAEDRVVITLDKDFGELVFLQGLPHRGIVRLVDISVRAQAAVCLELMRSHREDLSAGAIITAEPGRLRIRPAE